ncbi:MAG: ABC transporter permease [Bacteroidales bacterium]|jgi:putative ABC transport system permease protein|nr:ABC transporter permease [Bacteroidales bacterium]
MLIHHIKLVLNVLQRNKLYSLLSVVGFSVGFAVCLIIGLHIYGETTMDTWLPTHNRIVRLVDFKGNQSSLDMTMTEVFKNDFPQVEQACAMELIDGFDISVKANQQFALSKGMITTTDDFFKIFPLKVIRANDTKLFPGMQSIVITQSLANTLFQDADPLGKTIAILDDIMGEISAVVADFPKNSSIQADVFTNAENEDFRFSQSCYDGKCWNPADHYLLLRPDTDRTLLQTNLDKILASGNYEIESLSYQKLDEMYLGPAFEYSSMMRGNRTMLWVFAGLGVLVLLLSIINFVNFYIAMQYARLKIISIKKIHGAQFGQLLTYTLVEVSMSILIAVLLALALFQFMQPTAGYLLNYRLDAALLFTPEFLLLILLAILLIIFIVSAFPVIMLTRFKSVNVLSGSKLPAIRQTGRNLMTALQFTISIALIILTLSLYKQIDFVKHADLGFEKENLVRLNFPYTFQKQAVLRQKLSQLSDVAAFTFSSGVPGNVHLSLGDETTTKTIFLESMHVDDNFLQTLAIPLKAGRNFRAGESTSVCIMNQEAFTQYEWENMENRHFNQGRDGGYEVIGITENFFVESLHQKIKPVALLLADDNDGVNLRYATIRLRPGNIGDQMQALEKLWSFFIPDEPMNFTFYDQQFDAMYRKDERLGLAIAIAAIIAIILTFMGIVGQVFQMILNRTKEIGIRKVNGAKVSDIIFLFNKVFIKWVANAFVVASPAAFYVIKKWQQNFAYQTTIDWWIFALAGLLTLFGVLLTVSLQTYNAARRNPVKSLRDE